MYYFDGDFKSRQQQSFSGASKKEQAHQLVSRQAEERKKREVNRKRAQCALRIQSFYRGFRCRQQLKAAERLQFDGQFTTFSRGSDVEKFVSLAKSLCFFYQHDKDHDRLVNLCKWCLVRNDVIVQFLVTSQDGRGSYVHVFKKLLALCSWSMERSCESSAVLATPLRMLEVFTTASATDSARTQLASLLLQHIVNAGFYRTVRRLCDSRLPDSVVYGVQPRVALADALMELAMRPLLDSAGQVRSDGLRSLSEHFLCCAFSRQVEHYVLPALVDKFSASLLSQLLQYLAKVKVSTPDRAPWLLRSLLALADRHLDGRDVEQYVLIIGDLVTTVMKSDNSLVSRHHALAYMHDFDDDDMDTDEDTLVVQCTRHINSPHLADAVSAIADTQPSTSVTAAICRLSYFLLSNARPLDVGSSYLLNRLMLNSRFLRHLWQTCTSLSTYDLAGSSTGMLRALMFGTRLSDTDIDLIIPLVYVFCYFMNTLLLTLHDDEFFNYGSMSSMPFPLPELVPMVTELRDLCLGLVELAYPESMHHLSEAYQRALQSSTSAASHLPAAYQFTWTHLFLAASSLLRQLYARNIRRPFCRTDQWLCFHLNLSADKVDMLYKAYTTYFLKRPFGNLSVLNPDRFADEECPAALSVSDIRMMTVLKELPFVVPFEERVKLFQHVLTKDKLEHQGDTWLGRPIIDVTVRRDYLYEDSFEKLSPENEPNMKVRMQVKMKNAIGLDEAGIDGGGITREFLNELLKTAFDPNRGFFRYTYDKLLYPNPQATVLEPDPAKFAQHYFFLGRILGKAIYEKMLVELPFAAFFLSKILGRHGNVDIHHLVSLDPELYRNLLVLKQMPDVSDMGLDFTVVNNELGKTAVTELKAGGRDIVVTNGNKIEYIHLMSNYKLNRQIVKHCTAFRNGLSDVVDLGWLALFDHNELQVLISGAHVPVDVNDLKKHTAYTAPYSAEHATIQMFWRVFDSLTDVQRRQLLKFATSCSRPPLLGFKDLHPPFCIQPGGSDDRLPTASTCMNLLKLPAYPDFETMKQKLLYSIEAGAGFELS